MTLGEFVKYIIASAFVKGVSIPYEDERAWHLLLYKLKQRELCDQFSFIKSLRFDWNGRTPKCRELSEYLHALHLTGSVSAKNPEYATILPTDPDRWLAYRDSVSGQEGEEFLGTVEQMAEETFRTACS